MRERKGGENTFKKKKDRKARKEKPDQSVRTERNSLIAAHKFGLRLSTQPLSHWFVYFTITRNG